MQSTTDQTVTPPMWADPRTALAEWEREIKRLDVALRDAATARERISVHEEHKALAEAELVLKTDGRNAEERKARVQVALLEDDIWPGADVAEREARERLADAERRIALSKERCRLLRAAVALHTGEEARS